MAGRAPALWAATGLRPDARAACSAESALTLPPAIAGSGLAFESLAKVRRLLAATESVAAPRRMGAAADGCDGQGPLVDGPNGRARHGRLALGTARPGQWLVRVDGAALRRPGLRQRQDCATGVLPDPRCAGDMNGSRVTTVELTAVEL